MDRMKVDFNEHNEIMLNDVVIKDEIRTVEIEVIKYRISVLFLKLEKR